MRTLDETDMEILSLLTGDARRSFSSIGDEVGLSGPAVSDRVTRLEESGVIEGFTVEMNREHLGGGVPVFVRFENDPSAVDALRDRLAGADGVEHVFVTAEGEVWFHGRAEGANVRRWIEGLLDDVPTTAYSVTLVDAAEWTPSLDGTAFAVTCVECGNTVDSEGESARIDDTVYHFCCPSCRSQFDGKYSRLAEDA